MAQFIYKHRRGTTEKWQAATSIIPYDGELIIEERTDGTFEIKVGDGVNNFNNLPYVSKEEIVKSDLAQALKDELDGKATKQYVDDAIEAIPTPDVSGQINTHNTSSTAHSDIRTAIGKKLDTSAVTGDLLTHNAAEFATAAQGALADSALQSDDLDGYATETYVDNAITAHTPDVSGQISAHNTSETAHNDIRELVANKVDKETGKGLSTNDFTAVEKEKLAGIATGANAYVLPAAGNSLGGVKSGGDVTIADGVITVNDDSHAHTIDNVDGLKSALDGKLEVSDLNGYAKETYVGDAVTTHNTNTSAHNDIRDLITTLTNRLNGLADSTDTDLDQLSEIVAYIKSNKSLIEEVTTNKVNVADIVNNLTTNVANKPLSAAQGVAIKGLIDALQTAVNGKADAGHSHEVSTTSATVIKSISGGSGSFTPTTKYLHKSTASAAPNAHTHTVTVSGTTGANSGSAVLAITGVEASGTETVLTGVKSSSSDTFLKSINGGSGSLVAYDAAANGNIEVVNGTRIPVVTSISSTGASANGTANVLTGVKASDTDTFLKSINGGSGDLTSDGDSSDGIKYISEASHTAASLGAASTASAAPNAHTHTVTVSGTTGANSGSAVSVATGALSSTGSGATVATGASGTASVLTGVKASGTDTFVKLVSFENGILTLETATAVTGVAANGTATVVTGVSTSKLVTSTAAPNTHTHSYGSSTALTTKTNSGSAITAVTGYPNFSGGSASHTTKYLHHTHTAASNGTTANAVTGVTSNGTATVLTGVKGGTTTATTLYLAHTHNAASAGTTANAVTGVGANGTVTAITGVRASGTASVAPSGHTHGYGGSTALTTNTNSGTAVNAITDLAANTTKATGDITYLESATHNHTGASVASTETVLKSVAVEEQE